jgi:hypothetical protein
MRLRTRQYSTYIIAFGAKYMVPSRAIAHQPALLNEIEPLKHGWERVLADAQNRAGFVRR